MAKIVAYEGPDRVGKATQSNLMLDYLRSRGLRASRVEVPVKNFLHKRIYAMLKNGQAKRHPYVFQLLQVANRMVFQLFELPKLEKDNDVIIFDRWSLSSWVYGLATGLDRTYVNVLMKVLRRPDCTVILTGSAQVQETRDDFEKDVALQMRVRHLYETYGKVNVKDTVLVAANQPREVVFSKVLEGLGRTGVHFGG